MTAEELLDDPEEVETKPDAPGPLRVMHSASREDHCEWLLSVIDEMPPTQLRYEYRKEATQLLLTYRAWQHDNQPHPEVIIRTQRRYQELDVAVRAHDAGER